MDRGFFAPPRPSGDAPRFPSRGGARPPRSHGTGGGAMEPVKMVCLLSLLVCFVFKKETRLGVSFFSSLGIFWGDDFLVFE